jgi:hypothetical protein
MFYLLPEYQRRGNCGLIAIYLDRGLKPTNPPRGSAMNFNCFGLRSRDGWPTPVAEG